MPGVEDRYKTDPGLGAIEGTLILHSSTTCIILHHYWDFMLVALNFIVIHISICTYFFILFIYFFSQRPTAARQTVLLMAQCTV